MTRAEQLGRGPNAMSTLGHNGPMIYFMAPDVPGPSGGLRVMHDFVQALRVSGTDAVVWHGKRGSARPDHSPVPSASSRSLIIEERSLVLDRGDVLVVPETNSARWKNTTKGVSKVVLNQGHFLTLSGLREQSIAASPYPTSSEAVAAVATSRAIEEFLGMLCPGLTIFYSPVSVDTTRFAPAPYKKKVIAWMPRKRSVELRLVTETLKRRGHLREWSFVPLDGVSPSVVEETLNVAQIFLLGNERDGLGLAGLEAMASGCSTIGFLGGGGREYAHYPLCTPIEDGEIADMVRTVEAAARQEPSAIDIATSRELIERDHGKAMCDASAVETFARLMEPGSPAVVRSPTRVCHYDGGALMSTVRRSAAVARRLGLR